MIIPSNDQNDSCYQESKKRIAIMTWYHYRNYGTALQASALYKVISDMGFQTQIIQYRPVGNILQQNEPRSLLKRGYNSIHYRLFETKLYHSKGRERLFQDYLSKRTTETGPITSEEDFMDLNNSFDAFVCGSDQIWSPLNYNDKYYLSFVKGISRKVAYAPSMGVSEIADPEVKRRITELLKGFQYLSVREDQGASIIKSLTGQNAKVVLDPTFLLTAAEWDEYLEVSSARKLQSPYILCYYLGDPGKYRTSVKEAADKWGLPVFELPTVGRYGRYAKFPFEVGPIEFASLIRNASFVFTDSFHGMAFSVIYKTPFVIFERFKKDDPRNQNSRIYSLVKLFGIEDLLMQPCDIREISKLPECDFTACYEKLEDLRDKSFEYLRGSLFNAANCRDE